MGTRKDNGGDGESPAFSWWAQGRTTGGGIGRALLALVTLPVLGSETFLRPPLSDLGHGDAGVGSSEALPPPACVMILG